MKKSILEDQFHKHIKIKSSKLNFMHINFVLYWDRMIFTLFVKFMLKSSKIFQINEIRKF